MKDLLNNLHFDTLIVIIKDLRHEFKLLTEDYEQLKKDYKNLQVENQHLTDRLVDTAKENCVDRICSQGVLMDRHGYPTIPVIHTIKELRAHTGWDLRKTKEAVEQWMHTNGVARQYGTTRKYIDK